LQKIKIQKMKKNILFLCILVAGFCVASCSSGQKNTAEEEAKIIDSAMAAKPDWTDKAQFKAMINNHYIKNSFDMNRSAVQLKDPLANMIVSYNLKDIPKDSIFMLSNYVMIWTVKAQRQDATDTLLLDYKFSWTKPQTMTDTTKVGFTLNEVIIRKVNNQDRYYWKKKGNFWEKIMSAKLANL
jgi:hypothetical protein